MTVIVSKPAVNLREELASLRNQGGYQEQQFYFDGLVTNGTFDTDTSGWSVLLGSGASVSWVSGKARLQDTTNNTSSVFLGQAITTEVGRTYLISANATSFVNTGAKLYKSDNTAMSSNFVDSAFAAEGEHEFVFVATSTTSYVGGSIYASGGTATADFDNISVFEVDANDEVIHTMPKGWVPKDFYEDGLLQREGSAHDYEVVYDGFDYYVKPTVAPSATTQTCVIGVKA